MRETKHLGPRAVQMRERVRFSILAIIIGIDKARSLTIE